MDEVVVLDLDDVFSDESSFYGDDDLKQEFTERADSFDPHSYWTQREWDWQRIAVKQRGKSPVRTSKTTSRKREFSKPTSQIDHSANESAKLSSSSPSPPSKRARKNTDIKSVSSDNQQPTKNDKIIPETADSLPYNLYEGEPNAKQLFESVDTFLLRLPPSSTTASKLKGHSWIYVCNPATDWRPESTKSIQSFREEANILLDSHLQKRKNLESQSPDKPAGAITRILNPDRDILEAEILRLAKTYGIISGKWLIFCSREQVDNIWGKVAKATWDGNLGHIAKVSIPSSSSGDGDDEDTQSEGDSSEDDTTFRRSRKSSSSTSNRRYRSRSSSLSLSAWNQPPDNNKHTFDRFHRAPDEGYMICVYTSDFSDRKSVSGVLKQLEELGLADTTKLKPNAKAATVQGTIYYKCDAYTYLSISSGNDYKLRASMYSSRDSIL